MGRGKGPFTAVTMVCVLFFSAFLIFSSVLQPPVGKNNPTEGVDKSPVADDNPDQEEEDSTSSSTWRSYPYHSGPFVFPEDEGRHSDALEEWWYLNGHLLEKGGNRYDYVASFHGHGLFAASVLDVATGIHYNFTGMNAAVFQGSGSLSLDYAGNELHQIENNPFCYLLDIDLGTASLELTLEATAPPLIVNGDGEIEMGGESSYYYSLTDLKTFGTLHLSGIELEVSGESWMDRQWGDWNPNTQWDWFSVKLDDGTKILAYRMAERETTAPSQQYLSVLYSNGTAAHLNQTLSKRRFFFDYQGYWRSDRTRMLYSNGWRLRASSLGLDLYIDPLFDDQELYFEAPAGLEMTEGIGSEHKPFWEGSCTVKGEMLGKPAEGKCFVETTYDYGAIMGDLDLTLLSTEDQGEDTEFMIQVENDEGVTLGHVCIEFYLNDQGRECASLGKYVLIERKNSTVLQTSFQVPEGKDLWAMVDPSNQVAEQDERNNMLPLTNESKRKDR